MSTIELRWKDRTIGTAQTRRRFLDVVIDGQSLHETFGDLISPIGWDSDHVSKRALARFLRNEKPDLANERNSIYVCPECGDLDCGAISAVIVREGDRIIWRDFGYQSGYDGDVDFDDLENVGPYTFKAAEYFHVFDRALDNNDQK